MKKYKVIDIREQDYGCEELPAGQKYCVDVILQNIENNEQVIISVPDDELYQKNININSIVFSDGKMINPA